MLWRGEGSALRKAYAPLLAAATLFALPSHGYESDQLTHRDIELAALGWEVLYLTWKMAERPGFFLRNLRAVLADPARLKLYHFARFDLAAIHYYLKVMAAPVFCTKIASKLARTYTDRHGLKDLCRELLRIDISKQQQSSDWGAEELSAEQADYAVGDVVYLHRIREQLDAMQARENRTAIAAQCFAFLPTRARLDLDGFAELDIFHH